MNEYNDEVSLRDLYLIFRQGFWLIVLVALIAGAGAFLFASLRPDVFEAEATVLVTPTPERRIDGAGSTIIDRTNVDYLTYSSLAFTEPVLNRTMREAGVPLDEYDRFRERLTVSNLAGTAASTSGQIIVRHTATAESGEAAAELANIWAANTIQAVTGTMRAILEPIIINNEQTVSELGDGLRTLEDQWRELRDRDDTALLEAELNSFTARNAGASERLDSIQRDLAANLARQAALTEVLSAAGEVGQELDTDAGSVLALLESRELLSPGAANELRAFMQTGGTDTQLVRLLLGLELQSLTGAAAALEAQRTTTEEQLAEYAASAAERRIAIATLAQERTELERQLRIAETLYTNSLDLEPTLRYVNEMLDTNVQMLDPAAAPQEPSSGGRLMITLIAAVVGGLLATVFVFLRAAVMPAPEPAAVRPAASA